MERLQLAPISDVSLILGKILGGTVFGLIISFVMTLITLLFLGAEINSPVFFTIILLLTAFVHSALGATVAVSVKEVFEAQTLSNYFRFPMIFLCGVFLPVEKMPTILQIIARLLPLTYSVEGLRVSMAISSGNLVVNTLILVIYSLFLLWGSVFFLRKNQD